MLQFGVFTTVENHEIGYPQQTQEHSKIRMVQVICQVNFYDFFKKDIYLYIPLLNHVITGFGFAYLNICICALSQNRSTAKYICSLLRIFKIAQMRGK